MEYRATGITLMKLQNNKDVQLDLFGSVLKSEGLKQVFQSVDDLSRKYGKHAVFLGSSFDAMNPPAGGRPQHLGDRGDTPERTRELFKGETKRRRLAIPILGSVT